MRKQPETDSTLADRAADLAAALIERLEADEAIGPQRARQVVATWLQPILTLIRNEALPPLLADLCRLVGVSAEEDLNG